MSLSRADHERGKAKLFHALLETTRRGGDTAHSLHEVQANSFERKQLYFISLGAQQCLAGPDHLPAFLLDFHVQAMRTQQKREFFDTGNNSAFACQHGRYGAPASCSYGFRRQIPRAEISLKQIISEFADGPAILRIFQYQAASAAKRSRNPLFTCVSHL
jgi:hypothetical protein